MIVLTYLDAYQTKKKAFLTALKNLCCHSAAV
ncbi:Uncharacterised protein [Streptococcus mutans]|nr:Uncharacterised protein [Streptococcus mutans]